MKLTIPKKVIQSINEWAHKLIIRNNGYAGYLRRCEKHNVKPLISEEEAKGLHNE